MRIPFMFQNSFVSSEGIAVRSNRLEEDSDGLQQTASSW